MIEIWTEELPKDFHWTPDNYCSGTVEFYVNTAECSALEAIVYYDGSPREYNGVIYLPRKFYKGEDIVLACNSVPPRLGRYNIAWCNWYDKRDSYYLAFDERIVPSNFFRGIFGNNSRVVSHGVWPEKFIGDNLKNKGQCLYSSSPDRGGDFLKEIWPEVQRETGASLIMTYKTDISEKDMIRLYKESQFWLHPGQGIELFCISAVKAQLAGCIPVVVPTMALAETAKWGVKTTIENYKNDLINAIRNPPPIEHVYFDDWEIVTKELFKNIV